MTVNNSEHTLRSNAIDATHEDTQKFSPNPSGREEITGVVHLQIPIYFRIDRNRLR